jgi:hypothetical protein
VFGSDQPVAPGPFHWAPQTCNISSTQPWVESTRFSQLTDPLAEGVSQKGRWARAFKLRSGDSPLVTSRAPYGSPDTS